jgi:hypothetical protein
MTSGREDVFTGGGTLKSTPTGNSTDEKDVNNNDSVPCKRARIFSRRNETSKVIESVDSHLEPIRDVE